MNERIRVQRQTPYDTPEFHEGLGNELARALETPSHINPDVLKKLQDAVTNFNTNVNMSPKELAQTLRDIVLGGLSDGERKAGEVRVFGALEKMHQLKHGHSLFKKARTWLSPDYGRGGLSLEEQALVRLLSIIEKQANMTLH